MAVEKVHKTEKSAGFQPKINSNIRFCKIDLIYFGLFGFTESDISSGIGRFEEKATFATEGVHRYDES